MIVNITTSDVPFKVVITTPKPEVLSVGNTQPINITISVIKDGEKGNDGQDAINNTLEMVRAENAKIEGDIHGNGNTITNIRNAVDSQEPATLAQVTAILNEAKSYADTVSVESVRWAGYWNASSGSLPSNSQVRRGDEFEVNVAGSFAGVDFEVGDILRARINVPGQIITNWLISQGNVQQALENRQGTAKITTGSELENENSLNDSDIVTSKKLWQNFVPKLLSLPLNWLAKQTFAIAPRFSSLTGGTFLKLDNNKDVIATEKIQITDIENSEFFQKLEITDALDYTVQGTTLETTFKYYLVPAGTLKIGSVFQIDTQVLKTIVGNNTNISRLRHHTNQSVIGSNILVIQNLAATIVEWRFKAEIIIKAGNTAKLLLQDTLATGVGSSTVQASTFSFNPDIDNYFFVTIAPNNGVDVFKQLYFGLKRMN